MFTNEGKTFYQGVLLDAVYYQGVWRIGIAFFDYALSLREEKQWYNETQFLHMDAFAFFHEGVERLDWGLDKFR